jgi:hypothetical protein
MLWRLYTMHYPSYSMFFFKAGLFCNKYGLHSQANRRNKTQFAGCYPPLERPLIIQSFLLIFKYLIHHATNITQGAQAIH